MNRRTILKGAGATGLLAVGVATGTAAAADGPDVDAVVPDCNFTCCEDCRIAYCPNGCDCDRSCNEGVGEQ